MKKILAVLFLIYTNSYVGNCQLLINPSLTVEDLELALTNTGHLRKILKMHNFEYSTSGETRLIAPGEMANPLIPDLRAIRSEDWGQKNLVDNSVVNITIYEWDPEYAPQPEVIKTVRVMIRRDSVFGGKTDCFLEKIKEKYPDKSKRYFRNSELYKSFGEPYTVFTNNSKIEVRTETVKPVYSHFYIVNFDLLR